MIFFLLALPWILPCAVAATNTDFSRPDIILVTLDAVRADHVGAYGYARPTTPWIDRLAAEGALFASAYSLQPWTLPSIASLLTSQDAEHHGAHIRHRFLAEEIPTFVDVLAENGYRLGGFLAGAPAIPKFGLSRRFEEVESRLELVDAYAPLNGRIDRAIAWIRQDPSRPFMIWVHGMNSHLPYQCPAPDRDQFAPGYRGPIHDLDDRELRIDDAHYRLNEFIDLYNGVMKPGVAPDPMTLARIARIQQNERDVAHLTDHYDGCLKYMDSQLSRLADFIERNGRGANTVWIVTADHGEYLGHSATRSEPRISHPIADLSEELLRIPLVIKAPFVTGPQRIRTPVAIIDVAPTLLGWLHLPIPPSMQGRVLPRRDAKRDPVVYAGDLDYAQGWSWRILQGRWKLRRTPTAWELFDLAADPHERVNVIDREPARFLEMSRDYLETLADSAPR